MRPKLLSKGLLGVFSGLGSKMCPKWLSGGFLGLFSGLGSKMCSKWLSGGFLESFSNLGSESLRKAVSEASWGFGHKTRPRFYKIYPLCHKTRFPRKQIRFEKKKTVHDFTKSTHCATKPGAYKNDFSFELLKPLGTIFSLRVDKMS